MRCPITESLLRLPQKNILPMHMPGHKRKYGSEVDTFYQYDITEIRGYDNLHEAEGIIAESMEEAAHVFGTLNTWYLVNGSTCGLQIAIAACVKAGDHVVMARNCHKAVYHMMELLGLHVHYIYPDYMEEAGISMGIGEEGRKELKSHIKNYPVKAVIVTSPTYEGVVTDIRSIKDILEPENIPLIVDEAHGAHFPFSEHFPESAIRAGADLVVQSVHKTLPAMTQTAVLHRCSHLIDKDVIDHFASVFETSSPSYIMMSSIERSICYMEENVDNINSFVDNMNKFKEKCGKLKYIYLLDSRFHDPYDYDPSKLILSVKDGILSGKELADRLYDDYGIELEMSQLTYALAMTSVMDDENDFERLYKALENLDLDISKKVHEIKRNILKKDSIGRNNEQEDQVRNNHLRNMGFMIKQEKIFEISEAVNRKSEWCAWEEAEGSISASYISVYPPGIPVIVPGEKISKETVENMKHYLYNGYNVTGLTDHKFKRIAE